MGSTPVAGNKKEIGKIGKSGEIAPEIILQARKEYGRYFGVFRAFG